MITFTQLGRLGRLGNQLFQYAVVRAISLERGYELKIPNFYSEGITWQNQECQLNNFNIECSFLEPQDFYKINNRYDEHNHAIFYHDVFNVPDNTDLHGYFQNYQYFSKYEKEIRCDFKLREDLEEHAKEYIESLKKNNEQIVSVHFRRGDNSDGTNSEYNNYYGQDGKLSKDSIFGKYFYEALEAFHGENFKFLVFSGGSRKGTSHNQADIDWCKKNLDNDKFLFCEGNSDMQDFAIMKNCDHNLTTHMTSFGWWAAFLNENPDKIVIAPKNYSVPDDGRVKYGFYPKTWKII